MMVRRAQTKPESLSSQVEARLRRSAARQVEESAPVALDRITPTGSTLLDLAISAGVYPEGGLPSGILVEVFGPSGCGKTVLLCEIAGYVQRRGGQIMFRDPEARLNNQFAARFGFRVENSTYSQPDTVPEVFEPVRNWSPEGSAVHGIFADSLAALSTEMEMKGEDKYGMRRAKEMSEECRKTCRVLAQRGYLMVCSNQVRHNLDAGMFGEKYKTPGGESIGFYSSLRLRCHSPVKTPRTVKIGGKEHKRVVGVCTTVDVYKSSVDQPFRTAPVHIVYDYGIDDIRANLSFVKDIVGGNFYMLDETQRLQQGLDQSIQEVEEGQLEAQLKRYTIQLWREREERFRVARVVKRR